MAVQNLDPERAHDERHVKTLEQSEDDMKALEKSPGVRRIEAVISTFTAIDRVMLFVGLTLSAYARGLGGYMLPAFQSAAISEWNAAGQASTLGVVRSAIAAASQPIWAKLMDYMGRTFVVFAAALFYVLGYVVMAASNNFATLAGGLVLQVFGFGAQNISMYVIIADTTSMRWRVLFSMIPSIHSVINVWAGGVIAAKVAASAGGWRWGYGINTIIYPVLALPLFLALVLASHRARRRGLLKGIPSPAQVISTPAYWVDFFWKADVVGLVFLCASIALCLIPLTLGGGSSAKWRTADVLAPFLLGFLFSLPAFIVWETRFARHPILPLALLRDRHILLSCLLSGLFTITGAAQSTYLYFTLVVPFGKSVEVATRVSRLSSFAQALSGVGLGLVIRYVRYPKPFTIAGCVLYLVAYGLLYRYRGGHSAGEFNGLVGGEIVLGIAMGIAQNAAQVGIQAVCKHEHLAIVSAVYFCCYQIGAGIGSAISGAIWTNKMLPELTSRLSAVGGKELASQARSIYGNPLAWVAKNPPGTPARVAVDEAYRHLQHLLCITGLVFSAVLIFVSLFLKNVELTDKRTVDDASDFSIRSRTEREAEMTGKEEVSTPTEVDGRGRKVE